MLTPGIESLELVNVISTRREKFRVDIRKKQLEKVLSIKRQVGLCSSIFIKVSFIKEFKIDSDTRLTQHEVYEDLIKLTQCLVSNSIKLNEFECLELINSIGHYFDHFEGDDDDDMIKQNSLFSQTFDHLLWYSSGNCQDYQDSFSIIFSASKALKKIVQKTPSLIDTLVDDGLVETILFLLCKDQVQLIKKGIQILLICVMMYDETITNKLFYTQVFTKDVKTQILNLIQESGLHNKIKRRIIKCICFAIQTSKDCLQYFVQQQIVPIFVDIFLQSDKVPFSKHTMIESFINILKYYENNQDEMGIKQQFLCKNFLISLQDLQFGEIQTLARVSEELCAYLND